MKEDDLLRRLINEMYGSDDNLYPEARYNNYGTRGVVDLYADTATSDHVYEFKSESAVRDVTGANEITRQFNKHCENFFKGSSFDRQERWTTFELCFLPTPITAAHVIDNSTIYKQCIGRVAKSFRILAKPPLAE